MLDYYSLRQGIKKYRQASHMTQEQLATIVDISDTHMSHIKTANKNALTK